MKSNIITTILVFLRKHNMLIHRKKAHHKTTNSFHRFYKYRNIIKDMEITKPNQVWVSDITYIRTINGFCYLAQTFDNLAHAKRATKNAINLYNEIRLHLSLNYNTPNEVYQKAA